MNADSTKYNNILITSKEMLLALEQKDLVTLETLAVKRNYLLADIDFEALTIEEKLKLQNTLEETLQTNQILINQATDYQSSMLDQIMSIQTARKIEKIYTS